MGRRERFREMLRPATKDDLLYIVYSSTLLLSVFGSGAILSILPYKGFNQNLALFLALTLAVGAVLTKPAHWPRLIVSMFYFAGALGMIRIVADYIDFYFFNNPLPYQESNYVLPIAVFVLYLGLGYSCDKWSETIK